MAYYYCDSSVLVKRYVRERGTDWVRQLTDPGNADTITTVVISQVEVVSALNRRRREQTLDHARYDLHLHDFQWLCAHRYSIVPLHADLIPLTWSLLERHPLRAYDAIQLATALLVQTTLRQGGSAGLIFLSADQNLLVAAAAEGLVIENPNQHP